MRCGLGIDTGGTYTDAVIYDFDNDKILNTAKSITVKEDLTLGINGVLNKLPAQMLEKVKLVSLSTTLATNACVEGKGSRAVLVLIGISPKVAASYGHEYGLPDVSDIVFLDGGHNQQGELAGEPDWDFLKEEIEKSRYRTDSYAVVELWGIRNPTIEKKAKELITGWTGRQVICGHELTGELNSLKRAATALINAQLVPLINDFLNAVRTSLKTNGIEAPLVIVRGDGSLMSEEFARGKPVETLLSGPSASVAGGISLTGSKNCIIVDMGGTTSDIAIVRNGIPRLAMEGAVVGRWRTGTRSIQINTVGLGGDSLIRHTRENTVSIGPLRAAPLSWAASRWPSLSGKIKDIYNEKKRHTKPLCEFLYLVHQIAEDSYYTDDEKRMAEALKEGPLSVVELAEAVGASIYDMNTGRLEQHGAIMRCGLTPTDLMHITGDFAGWDKEAAHLSARIMAYQLNISLDKLIAMVNEKIKESLYSNIAELLINDEDEDILKGGASKQLTELISMAFRHRNRSGDDQQSKGSLKCSFSTSADLVGIGAPIHIYLPDVAKALGTVCLVPENAAVANAVGAITGNVMVEESVIIKPLYEVSGIKGYICYASSGNKEFTDHQKAVEWSRQKALELVGIAARQRGSDKFDVTVSVNNDEAEIAGDYIDDTKESGHQLLIETIVIARAAGKIKWPIE